MKLQTVKGFKDYLPAEALRRKFVMDKIKQVFEKFGFDPLETPTLEYEETLTGKYGEDEKLIYKFETPGKDKVALKYDQTVPLARVVAQYGPRGEQTLTIPFKRYQIQPAYRGENTQKGRYREFMQCDADVIGVSSPLADAEILAVAYEIYKSLGLDVILKVNDRTLLQGIEPKFLATLDKYYKIGEGAVLRELKEKGLSPQQATELFGKVQLAKLTENLNQIIALFTKMGYPKEALMFDSLLIRGLDYYTGMILEVVLNSDPKSSSLGGGGRYDQLIGKLSGNDLPATGFSVGLDRTIEAMEQKGVMTVRPTNTQVLVTVFDPSLEEKSLEVALRLRSENINTEIWLEPGAKLDKQFKYADKKGIPYVIVIGSQEIQENVIVLKSLKDGSQEKLSLDQAIKKLSPQSP